MSRILLLGGYGGFGARIARRLASSGYEVLVAGRSASRAAQFCDGVAGLVPVQLDRADIAAALELHRPALVVDASGPFQAMEYSVPKACINAKIPYCDIADGRDFVCGIAALDRDAREAGVAIVSGASSVPALSGAVIRELAEELDEVRAVEIAISASNRAAAGPAVAAAILGQVGQSLDLMRAGRWQRVYGWQEIKRQDFRVAGTQPIVGRLVALADVPDLMLLPGRLRGMPAVTFRAGTELAFQNIALWLASWLVRWGCLRSVSGLRTWLQPLQTLTARLGSDRSSMIVRLFGEKAGQPLERRWTLIANKGDGPEIPALSVPLLVARILDGREPPGARDAGLSLDLADYAPIFAGLAITSEILEVAPPPPLFRRVMGNAFDTLPSQVRAMHQVWRDGAAAGEGTVAGADTVFGRLIGRIIGFPPPGKHPLYVSFTEADGIETWTRDFGGHTFSSCLSQHDEFLIERFGPLRFHFHLRVESAALVMVMRKWSVFGLRMPLLLAPKTRAREIAEGGRFHFDVLIKLPLIGRIVHYQGWLKPCMDQAHHENAQPGKPVPQTSGGAGQV